MSDSGRAGKRVGYVQGLSAGKHAADPHFPECAKDLRNARFPDGLASVASLKLATALRSCAGFLISVPVRVVNALRPKPRRAIMQIPGAMKRPNSAAREPTAQPPPPAPGRRCSLPGPSRATRSRRSSGKIPAISPPAPAAMPRRTRHQQPRRSPVYPAA